MSAEPPMSARLTGFGVSVRADDPHRIERIADAPETVLRVWRGESSVDVDVLAGSDVVEIAPGSARSAWAIETAEYVCIWPHGLALASDPDGVSPFLLLGPDESLAWISGPIARERAWPIESLAGEGQKVRAVAETEAGQDARIDLDYVEEGELWWQRRYVRAWGEGRVLVVSAQARAAHEETMRAAIDLIEASLAPAERPS